MMAVSASEPDGEDEAAGANEVDARKRLRLVFHHADEPFANAAHPRVRAEKRMFLQVCLADLGIALGYAAIPYLLGGFEFDDPAKAGLVVGIWMAAFTVMRWLLHQGQFRAYDLSRSRGRQRAYRWVGRIVYGILVLVSFGAGGTATNLVHLPDILRAIFGPRVRMLLTILVVAWTAYYAVNFLSTDSEYDDQAYGLLIAAVLHACAFAALAGRRRKAAGLRLLVLRVFKIDETASFLFSGLMQYWRHFGNHLTIMDESLVRQGYSNSFIKTVFLAFFLIAALLLATIGFGESWFRSRLGRPLSTTESCLLVAIPAVLIAWALLKVGQNRIDRKFTRRLDQVLASLRRLELYPRHLDLSFRFLQALCQRNTWFPAAREFASRADVVLMDLRGYTEQRKGCRQEVNFLFDAVPLPHLLFLIDTANDRAVVEEMMQGRWARLNKTSPNLLLPNPVVHLYEVRDNDERDMQAILDRLITIADTPGGLWTPGQGLAVPA